LNLTDLIGRVAQWLTNEQAAQQRDLAKSGQAAIDTAGTLWHSDIFDPRRTDHSIRAESSRKAIDSFIHEGLGWTWEPPYAGDGDFEWCGAFAAYCWSAIKPELRKTYFASTYRLDRYARYQSVNGEKNSGKGRLIADLDEHSLSVPWEPHAGDILLIGPPGSGYGKHICLVESYNWNGKTKVFRTIEGNGTGRGPDGKQRQGVVCGERHLGGNGWHARRLIRPSVEDLI
jgi:hypothetical protein